MIVFSKLSKKEETLIVKVLDKYLFETFEELYSQFDFDLFGCEGYTTDRMIKETYNIYTKDKEKECGALGIKIVNIEVSSNEK